MKKLALIPVIAFLLFSCSNPKNQKQAVEPTSPETVIFTVDELYNNATDMVDKEIVVKGTVMHVCKQGGGRCFLMGSNENITIRVEAGEKIGAFNQEQMGSDLEIVGVLKEVKTEADAHNTGIDHSSGELSEGENMEDADTENAHRVIAESQEAVEVVYFIEGLRVKEL